MNKEERRSAGYFRMLDDYFQIGTICKGFGVLLKLYRMPSMGLVYLWMENTLPKFSAFSLEI